MDLCYCNTWDLRRKVYLNPCPQTFQPFFEDTKEPSAFPMSTVKDPGSWRRKQERRAPRVTPDKDTQKPHQEWVDGSRGCTARCAVSEISGRGKLNMTQRKPHTILSVQRRHKQSEAPAGTE